MVGVVAGGFCDGGGELVGGLGNGGGGELCGGSGNGGGGALF